MADLAKLFSKKDSNATPKPAESDGANKSGQLPSPAPAEQAATPQPANPFARPANNGQNNSSGEHTGGTPSDSAGDSVGGQPESRLGNVFGRTRTSDNNSDSKQVDAPPVNSLESLDTSTDEGVAPRGSGISYFADETPATKPTRELPEGLTKEQLGFIDTLDSVYNIIHDPELLGGVIKNIMIELKSNAEYTKLIAPDDVRVMVRGMRESMGLARVKKQETKAKRAGGTRSSKKVDLDMLADLDSLGID